MIHKIIIEHQQKNLTTAITKNFQNKKQIQNLRQTKNFITEQKQYKQHKYVLIKNFLKVHVISLINKNKNETFLNL